MPSDSEPPKGPLAIRRVAGWFVLVIVICFTLLLLAGVGYGVLTKRRVFNLVIEHFPAVVGLPGAALVAAAVVMFLEHTSGPIQFEGLGFKFKGASGQIVLWIFCFLAITAAIRILW